MRTGNPALGETTFDHVGVSISPDNAMTIQGTVNKTAILLLLVMLPAAWTWNKAMTDMGQVDVGQVYPFMIGGLILGLVFALVTIFKNTWAPYTAPIYAICEGFFLGAFSAFFETKYPGLVFSAVTLTFGVLLIMLLAYKSRLIRATENFKMGVVAATGGIFLVYFVTFILGLFGVRVPYIHESGLIGIGFSIFVVIIAALNLVLDFDFIEKGAESRAAKYLEWYGAFALMVTLIWLYIEILRLLAKLRD